MATTISEEVLGLMRDLEQLQTGLPDRMDALGEVRGNEPSRAAA